MKPEDIYRRHEALEAITQMRSKAPGVFANLDLKIEKLTDMADNLCNSLLSDSPELAAEVESRFGTLGWIDLVQATGYTPRTLEGAAGAVRFMLARANPSSRFMCLALDLHIRRVIISLLKSAPGGPEPILLVRGMVGGALGQALELTEHPDFEQAGRFMGIVRLIEITLEMTRPDDPMDDQDPDVAEYARECIAQAFGGHDDDSN